MVQLSESVKLVAPRHPRRKTYLHKPEGSKLAVPLWSMPMIGHNGFVYCASTHLQIFDVDGKCRFETQSMTDSHDIGNRFRIENVVRKGDVVMAVYQCPFSRWEYDTEALEVMGQSGWLRIDPDRGFTGRCVKSAQE